MSSVVTVMGVLCRYCDSRRFSIGFKRPSSSIEVTHLAVAVASALVTVSLVLVSQSGVIIGQDWQFEST